MSIFPGIFALLFAAAAQGAESAEEVFAKPIDRRPPEYPMACQLPAGEEIKPQTVVVMFDVNRDGLTENVRVRESTDQCFEEAAIIAVRAWQYEPRRVNGRRAAQTDVEVVFSFVFPNTSQSDDFDARPLYREPPTYPGGCRGKAKSTERLLVQFDVTAEGRTKNISVIESTNPCFNASATRAVAKWRYRPKIVSGEPVVRKDVITQITYQLSGRGSPEREYRRAVLYKLKHIESLIRRDKIERAFSELDALETKYGDTFSPPELSDFLRVRAVARVKAKDYAGALDDLRRAQKLGLPAPMHQAVGEMIAQLEAVVAAQQAGAGGEAEGSAGEAAPSQVEE